jgi:hypothetical protein
MSLPVTFWLSFVLVHVVYFRGVSELVMQGWKNYPGLPMISMTFLFIVFGLFIWATSSIAIWRSATQYTGSRAWAGVAKFWIGFNIILNVAAFLGRWPPG